MVGIFFVALAGVGAHCTNIATEDSFRFRPLGQNLLTLSADAQIVEIEGSARFTFDWLWFRRLAAATIRIAGPAHNVSPDSY